MADFDRKGDSRMTKTVKDVLATALKKVGIKPVLPKEEKSPKPQ